MTSPKYTGVSECEWSLFKIKNAEWLFQSECVHLLDLIQKGHMIDKCNVFAVLENVGTFFAKLCGTGFS